MHMARAAAAVLLCIASRAVADKDTPFKAEILYPAKGEKLTVYLNDAILVRYNSEIKDNSLYTWCRDGDKITQKNRVKNAASYNGAEVVTVDWTSPDGCWFNLKSNENPNFGGHNGGGFSIINEKRAKPSTFGLDVATSTSEASSSSTTASSKESDSSSGVTSAPSATTTSDSEASATSRSQRTGEVTLLAGSETSTVQTTTRTGSLASASATGHNDANGDSANSSDKAASSGNGEGLGTAAKIGLGVGIAVGVIGIVALAVAFWLFRRRQSMGAEKSVTYADSEELHANVPKHPWRASMSELSTKHEVRRGHHHELAASDSSAFPVV